MRSHAIAKHKVKDSNLAEYTRRCQLLSQSGLRISSKLKVLKLLGRHACSPSHVKSAIKVLRGHMVHIGRLRLTQPKRPSRMRLPPKQPKITAPQDSGRRRTTARLRDAGFIHDFTSLTVSKLASVFGKVHPQARSPKAVAATQMVERYLKWAEGMGWSATNAILSSELPIEFFKQLGQILQPNSLRNHASSVIELLNLGQTESVLSPFFPPSKRKALRSAKKIWASLKNSAEKEARRVQRLKTRQLAFKNAPLYAICVYLEEIWKNDKFADNCSLLKCRFQMGRMLSQEDSEKFRENLCVLSLYLGLHGQRKSTAFRILPEELAQAQEMEGRFIISAKHHKTFASSGPALVALKYHQLQAFQLFADARAAISEPDTPIISSLSGKEPSDVFTPINKYLEDRHGINLKITFNWLRRTVESNKDTICQDIGQAERYRASAEMISGYLVHGSEAVQHHYDFQTARKVIMKSAEVDNVLAQLIAIELLQIQPSSFLPVFHAGTWKVQVTSGYVPLVTWAKMTWDLLIASIILATCSSTFFLESYPSFSLLFSDHFPAIRELSEAIWIKWTFPDVTFTQLSTRAYETIQMAWREQHRNQLVSYLADRLRYEDREITKTDIQTAVKYLQDVWKSDTCNLVEMVYNNLVK